MQIVERLDNSANICFQALLVSFCESIFIATEQSRCACGADLKLPYLRIKESVKDSRCPLKSCLPYHP